MTTQLVIVCVTILLVARVVTGAVLERTKLLGARQEDDRAPLITGHRVTVHTKKPDDQTIFGVVVGDYSDRLVLEAAEYVTPLGGTPLPGVQHIARRDIAWVDLHALVTVPDHVPASQPAPVVAAEAQ